MEFKTELNRARSGDDFGLKYVGLGFLSLLYLLEGCDFREGSRDICVWTPNPSRGFTCKPLFSLLIDPCPSPIRSLFLMWSGGPRFLRKLGSLSDKSCLVV